MEGAAFLRNVVETFPYQINIVLTENGMAFADLPKSHSGPSRSFLGPHIFDRVCIATTSSIDWPSPAIYGPTAMPSG